MLKLIKVEKVKMARYFRVSIKREDAQVASTYMPDSQKFTSVVLPYCRRKILNCNKLNMSIMKILEGAFLEINRNCNYVLLFFLLSLDV
jgi:hypothetical protein